MKHRNKPDVQAFSISVLLMHGMLFLYLGQYIFSEAYLVSGACWKFLIFPLKCAETHLRKAVLVDVLVFT